jgi:hypothetical protein
MAALLVYKKENKMAASKVSQSSVVWLAEMMDFYSVELMVAN